MEDTFAQFLARDSMMDAESTVKAAGELYKEMQGVSRTKEILTEALMDLASDENVLSESLLRLVESRGIKPDPDVVRRVVRQLKGYVEIKGPPEPRTHKKPASFALPTSPTGKRKMNRQARRKPRGWNNFLMEVCELMNERHAVTFRENVISMRNWFSESKDSKFSKPVGSTGIYTRYGGSREIREACYEIVAKFGYPRDSLVIKDSKGAIL